MKRKAPKSHTYTIIGLLSVILGSSAFMIHSYTDNGAEQTQIESLNTSSLEVNDGDNMQQDHGNMNAYLQSPASGLQAAEGVEVYSNYDTQSQPDTEDKTRGQ